MLCLRELYAATEAHTCCTLELEDTVPSQTVLVVAIGSSVSVYTYEAGSGLHEEGKLTKGPHTLGLGSPVIAMTSLRLHQMVILWLQSRELLVVRYQANLPLPPASTSVSEDRYWHWIVLRRCHLGEGTIGDDQKARHPALLVGAVGAEPLPCPRLVATGSGHATCYVLQNLIHKLTVLVTEDAARTAAYCWSAPRIHNGSRPTGWASASTFDAAESDSARSPQQETWWADFDLRLSDEDLMGRHTVAELALRKREMAEALRKRTAVVVSPATVQCSCSKVVLTGFVPKRQPSEQQGRSRDGDYWFCPRECCGGSHYRDHTYAVLRTATTPSGQDCIYVFTANPTARVQSLEWLTEEALNNNGTRRERTLSFSSVPVIDALVTTTNTDGGTQCLWLLLGDGTLTIVDLEGPDLIGKGADWPLVTIAGLPSGFVGRRLQLMGEETGLAVLSDELGSICVVDLSRRRVTAALLGSGAMTGVCEGPEGSLIVSHSRGRVTRLMPALGFGTAVTIATGSPLHRLHPISFASSADDAVCLFFASAATRTRLLQYNCGRELTEIASGGRWQWLAEAPTLAAGCLPDGRILQCTPYVILAGSQRLHFQTAVAHAAVVGALGISLIAAEDGRLQLVGGSALQVLWDSPPGEAGSVSCLAAAPTTARAVVCLVGYWSGAVTAMRLASTASGEAWVVERTTACTLSAAPQAITLFPPDFATVATPDVVYGVAVLHTSDVVSLHCSLVPDVAAIDWEPISAVNTGSSAPHGEVVLPVLTADGAGAPPVQVVLASERMLSLLSFCSPIVSGAEGQIGSVHRPLASLVRLTDPDTPSDSESALWWRSGFLLHREGHADTAVLTDGHTLIVAVAPPLWEQDSNEEGGWILRQATPTACQPIRIVNLPLEPWESCLTVRAIPGSDTLVYVVDCGRGRSSRVVTANARSLRVVDAVPLPGESVLCVETLPSAGLLRTAEAVSPSPEGLLLLGTVSLDGQRGSIVLMLPEHREVVCRIPVGEGPCMDLCLQRCPLGTTILTTASATHERTGNVTNRLVEDPVLVVACCGSNVFVYRLVQYSLESLSSYNCGVPCVSVAVCYPSVSVGLGDYGNTYLLLTQGRGTGASLVNPEGHRLTGSDDEESDGASTAVIQADGNDATDWNFQGLRLLFAAFEPMIGAGATSQGTYCDRYARTDAHGNFYLSHPSLPLTGTPTVGSSVGSIPAITHCAGLPSAVTCVRVVGPRRSAAVERRQPRCLQWSERLAILQPCGLYNGGGSVSVFLPLQDGSLYGALEIPYAFAHPMMRLERILTDTYERWESLVPRGGGDEPEWGTVTHTEDYDSTLSIRVGNRRVRKQGVLCPATIQELLHLTRAAAAPTPLLPPRLQTLASEKSAAWGRLVGSALEEEYGGRLSWVDCCEMLSLW